MKWVEIAAVKGKDMSKAADKFEKRIVARWGALATVMAHNAFKGKFAEMCAKCGVDIEEMILHHIYIYVCSFCLPFIGLQ